MKGGGRDFQLLIVKGKKDFGERGGLADRIGRTGLGKHNGRWRLRVIVVSIVSTLECTSVCKAQ